VSDELVEVWRQPDGTWRWRYRIVEDHTELRSNRGYESAEEAVRSARQAYPGVMVVGPADHAASADGAVRRRAGMLRITLVSASAVFALLALWAALRHVRRSMARGR
jgi:hypothetical protein